MVDRAPGGPESHGHEGSQGWDGYPQPPGQGGREGTPAEPQPGGQPQGGGYGYPQGGGEPRSGYEGYQGYEGYVPGQVPEHGYTEQAYPEQAYQPNPQGRQAGQPAHDAGGHGVVTTHDSEENFGDYLADHTHVASAAARERRFSPGLVLTVVVGVVIAIGAVVLLVVKSNDYSTVPKAYIPASVNGQTVRDGGSITKEVTQALVKSSKLTISEVQVASGATGDRDAIPDTVLLTMHSTSGAFSPDMIDSVAGIGGQKQTVNVQGVPTTLLKLGAKGFNLDVWIGMAFPRDDVVVMAYAFKGGRAAAQNTVAAMLSSGKS